MKKEIEKALWGVTKDIFKAEEKRRKQNRPYRGGASYYQYSSGSFVKDIVFKVLPEAYEKATGSGQLPVSARTLFYQVRPLLQQYEIKNNKPLDYAYFSQTLLTAYRQEEDLLPLLYYEPRGVLYEPHTGKYVQLGTREVDSYDFPTWTYNKILYVEKKGLWYTLKAAQLAERYDMAIIAAEGYSTEAIRTLLENAESGDYQLFVLHDADPYGYNIGRTLRAATSRMPNYQVEVIDLGLRLQEAIDIGLQTETFPRRNAIPYELLSDLDSLEKEKWHVDQRGAYCERVELNAMTAPQLIEYIEGKLKANNAQGKVIPPDKELKDLVNEFYEDKALKMASDVIVEELKIDAMKKRIIKKIRKKVQLDCARQWIEDAFQEDDSQSWKSASQKKLDGILSELDDDFKNAVKKELLLLRRAC
jgi:hypothetical protein